MKKLLIPLVSVLAAFGFMASPAMFAIGQPSPVGPSPQGPFVQTGATILPVNPTTCMTFPANVTGGCKGAGTWNVSGLYINGANIQTQDMTIGTTNIVGGAVGNILGIGASNKLSATATTGTGNVVLGTSPTIASPAISTPTITGGMTYGGVSVGASPTGTGNLVLSTSPALTTPDLGTPSAATLTNATGLPTTGIAPMAANTVVGNATASSASPTALAVPSCSTGSSALTWTSASGFGCNSIQGAAITGTPAANNIATWADSTHIQGTTDIPNGTTATTQTVLDSSTKVATTSFVWSAMQYSPSTASARQSVSNGPRNTNGTPSFLPATSASLNLTAQNISAGTPLIISAAEGWNTATGASADIVTVIASNPTWSGLTATSTNYLYEFTSAGVPNYSFTTLAPIYQYAGTPSTTNGQFTFNISEMQGYFGNGTTAIKSTVVFLGEAVTNASTVTSTVAYAYNGMMQTAYGTLPAGGAILPVTHNLGIPGDLYRWDLMMKNTIAENGYVPGDVLQTSSIDQDNGSVVTQLPIAMKTNSISWYQSAHTDAGSLTSGTHFNLNFANWNYRFIFRRSF